MLSASIWLLLQASWCHRWNFRQLVLLVRHLTVFLLESQVSCFQICTTVFPVPSQCIFWTLGHFIIFTAHMLCSYHSEEKSVWDQCNSKDWLTTDFHFWKTLPERNLNGHLSAANHPIHFRFRSRIGFSVLANLTVPFIFMLNWFSLPWQQNLGQHGL